MEIASIRNNVRMYVYLIWRRADRVKRSVLVYAKALASSRDSDSV